MHICFRHSAIFSTLTATVLLSACATFGPGTVPGSYTGYSKAIQAARTEGGLLNIVRLRYQDAPVDMTISSISTHFNFELGASGEFGNVEESNTANISPFVGYSESPTITFVPQDGADYLGNIASPMSLETLTHPATVSERFTPLLRLAVAEINGIRNPLRIASPEYQALLAQMEEMDLHGELKFGFIETLERLSDPIPADRIAASDLLDAAKAGYSYHAAGDPGSCQLSKTRRAPVLWIDNRSPQAEGMRTTLGLAPISSGIYPLIFVSRLSSGDGNRTNISVRTRSILEVGVYLSNGVDVPADHRRQGLLPELSENAPQLDDFFHVRVLDQAPEAPGTAVEYRGRWFYIPDSDAHSKATFAALQLLYLANVVSPDMNSTPVLTLGVD